MAKNKKKNKKNQRITSTYIAPISEYKKRTTTTSKKKSETSKKKSTSAKETAKKQITTSKNSRVLDTAPIKQRESSQYKTTSEYRKTTSSKNTNTSAKRTASKQTSTSKNSRVQDVAPIRQRETSTYTTPKSDYNKRDTTSALSRSKNSRVQDVAPVKQTKKKDDGRTWFQKSEAFKDGYQFGDVTKTILGSTTDAVEKLTSGVMGMGEALVDASAYTTANQYLMRSSEMGIVPDMEEYRRIKTEMGKFIESDLYNEQAIAKKIISDPIKKTGFDPLANSVFGEKSDALIESAGQLGATAGLQVVGVPWFVTTGATTFGKEVENALKEGATYEEAGGSALISAGAEILSEKLTGGISFGGKTLGDSLLDPLTRRIADKTSRTLVKLGADASGESFEEVFSSVMSRLGSKLYKEESIGELLLSEEAMDEYIESAIGGFALGGGSNAINSVKANISGVDYATGLSENELKVVQREIDNRSKEAIDKKIEANKRKKLDPEIRKAIEDAKAIHGDELTEEQYKAIIEEVKNNANVSDEEFSDTKLNFREKNKVSDSVMRAMERGEIDTFTVEDTLFRDDALRMRELNEELETATPERKAEIQAELDTIKANFNNELGKSQLFQEIYRQNALKDEKLDYKLSENASDKAKKIVESAMKSGENNTRFAHERIDFLIKMADASDYDIVVANDSQLKKLGYYDKALGKNMENLKASLSEATTSEEKASIQNEINKLRDSKTVTINGLKKDGKIIVNIDSKNAIQTIVGHEITHFTEKGGNYKNLNKVITEYAKSIGDYGHRITTQGAVYKKNNPKITAEGIEQEVVADLVGEYVFTDEDFIRSLSTKEPSTFESIRDYIKHAFKMATAGSSEARQLEQAKRMFEKVYRETANTTKTDDVKYSLVGKENGIEVYETSEDVKKLSYSQRKAKLLDIMINEYAGRTAKFTKNGESYYALYDKSGVKKGVHGDKKSDNKGYKAKINIGADGNYIELAENSLYTGSAIEQGKDNAFHKNAKAWDYYVKTIKSDGNYFDVLINVKDTGNDHYVYDITLKEATSLPDQLRSYDGSSIASKTSISQNSENATKFSLSEDTNGNKLSDTQKEYFKDSKIVDENGNLKVMYHGSQESFTVFDKRKSKASGLYGKGFYFTESKSHAQQYGSQYEVYLNITNPIQNGTNNITKDQLRNFVEALADNEDYGIENYGYGATVDSITDDVYGKDDFAMLMDLNVTCVGNMVEAIELFNEVNGTDYNGIVAPTETVAFYPNQIKKVDNQSPTSDADIRFSLSESVEETKDLIAVHNLNGTELIKTLELGGLPMPSIAVIKAQDGHEMYGDVTLILPKETIDPKASKDNKVYGGDAWTPTYPKIEYKPNAKVEKKISDKYYDFAHKYGYDDARPLYRYVHELEDSLNRDGGESAMLEHLYNDTNLMQMYLQDTGKEKVQDIEKETVTKISEADAEMNQFLVDTLGRDLIKGFKAPNGESPMKHRIAYMEEHETEIRNAYAKLCEEVYGFTSEEVENVLNNTDRRALMKIMREAYMYTQNNGVTVKTEIDYEATREAIRNSAKDGYKEWVDSLFKGVEEKTGIRNNASRFTNSGNERSWNALHYENTLENVVKVMKQQDNGKAFFGGAGIWGVSTKEYGSIEEIKSDSDRLRNMSDEEYEEVKESYKKRLSDIAIKIMSKTERNEFMALDNAMECIVDAVRVSKTPRGIFKELKQYPQLNVTEKDAKDIVSLVKDISNMPTGYFEAKPKRAVGLDEVGVFVIPNNADAKLKQELLNKGYSIAEYNPELEGDRKRVVNQFEELKFSLSENDNNGTDDNGIEAPYRSEFAPMTVSEIDKLANRRRLAEQVLSDTERVFVSNGMVRMRNGEEVSIEDYKAIRREAITEFEEADLDYESAVSVKNAPSQNDFAPLTETDANIRDAQQSNIQSLTDEDMPPEVEAPIYSEDEVEVESPFDERDIVDVGKKNVKAYMYENPEVKPFFQEEAQIMLRELQDSVKGERTFNDQLYYETGGEQGWFATKRQTSPQIAELLDKFKYKYSDIEKGLKAIIEDHGKENNAVSKRIEFMLDERLRDGYTDFTSGMEIPGNPEYTALLKEKQITEYTDEAYNKWAEAVTQDDIAPAVNNATATEETSATQEDIAPVKEDTKESKEKQRKFVKTATESEVVNKKIVPEDLDQSAINYQPIPNKKTLGKANSRLDSMGYESSIDYFKSQFASRKVELEDVALGERLIQEAMKREDYDTARELIQDVSILGTELGQKVQALSIIQRLTPEGQLRNIRRIIERGTTRKDKAFEGVELTKEMEEKILKTRKKDGTFDQKELNKAVEDVKQELANQMKVTMTDKINAWRYLSMLGNPKTHIRNIVSNVAMKGTLSVKNAVARTIEGIAPVKGRTKTWESATDDVTMFAHETMKEVYMDIYNGEEGYQRKPPMKEMGGKYSDATDIKSKRAVFKNKILNSLYEFNSDMLAKEDWWFSKSAFEKSYREFLTANGIKTKEDINNNLQLIEKGKRYAIEQSQIATFQQYSWLANKIGDIERKNAFTGMAIGSVVPFKKTPINIAKTGLNYSPLGFAKTLTYDISEVKKGNMEASTLVDHLAQNITGSALTLVGYMLAMSGLLNGSGDDDKEGNYDYQLGKQSYSITIGDGTYSLSWLTPVAMPLFVGANAYEQLVEGQEWNGDVVVETLAQTLDPLSEMSFLSSLDSVLSSYDSGIKKFAGIGETMIQNYATQFVPTLSSQVASTMDDTKRSTKVSGDSGFKMFEETLNKLKYKIPGLRETLEPSTDIWGNEVKQNENLFGRAFENFIAPYSRRENIATDIDAELKDVYAETGEDELLPSIPYNYLNYNGEKYKMSAKEYTEYKKMYGQTANDMLYELFDTSTYKFSSPEEKSDMIERVYDYARDEANREYLAKEGVEYTNATEDGVEYYREDVITTVIKDDIPLDEANFKVKNPEKYDFFKQYDITYGEYKASKENEDTAKMYDWAYQNPEYFQVARAISTNLETYWKHNSYMWNNIRADKDENGNSIPGTKKEKIIEYINGIESMSYEEKLVLFKKYYPADDTYNNEIVDYLNSRDDISYDEMVTILEELDFEVDDEGYIYW